MVYTNGMETSPKDKQIKTGDTRNKRGSGRVLGEEVTKEEKKKRRFFFPVQQRTVLAESREEAESIINKEVKQ